MVFFWVGNRTALLREKISSNATDVSGRCTHKQLNK